MSTENNSDSLSIEEATSYSRFSTAQIIIVFGGIILILLFIFFFLIPKLSESKQEASQAHNNFIEAAAQPPIRVAPVREPEPEKTFVYSPPAEVKIAKRTQLAISAGSIGDIVDTKAKTKVSSITPRKQELSIGDISQALVGSEQAPRSLVQTVESASDGIRSNIQTSLAFSMPNNGTKLFAGAIIPAVLRNAVDSELGGEMIAHATRNVYSSDAKRLLVPKGAFLFGQYRAVNYQGSTRIFVIWNRIQLDRHRFAILDSGLQDDLGRSGLSGRVNTRFWQRFGGSILLSIIPAVFDTSDSSNSQTIEQVRSDFQSAASIALQNSINIPPVIQSAQGRTFNVMVNKDIDFSSLLQ